MLTRIWRAIRAFMIGTATTGNPIKGIAAVVISIIIPYLLYAFLGGAAFVLILAGIIGLVWYLAKREQ